MVCYKQQLECLLLNLMKPETLSTGLQLPDVSNEDRLAHDKLTHDKGCETGIVEFVVKLRVNDRPAINARQRVVKRTPASLACQSEPPPTPSPPICNNALHFCGSFATQSQLNHSLELEGGGPGASTKIHLLAL